ncbi:MAG: hypothetical protein JRE72_00870 [Deltaproteobacteria bacterium]|nr:hypothetical protein [Deltaproteobacteria bacterium]
MKSSDIYLIAGFEVLWGLFFDKRLKRKAPFSAGRHAKGLCSTQVDLEP